MDQARLVKISKYLSRHLRHSPDRIGIRLDGSGWVEVDALLAACNARGFRLIRASQGHSVVVDLGLAPTEPPVLLFHGTTAGWSTRPPSYLRAAGITRRDAG